MLQDLQTSYTYNRSHRDGSLEEQIEIENNECIGLLTKIFLCTILEGFFRTGWWMSSY